MVFGSSAAFGFLGRSFDAKTALTVVVEISCRHWPISLYNLVTRWLMAVQTFITYLPYLLTALLDFVLLHLHTPCLRSPCHVSVCLGAALGCSP